MKVIDKNGWGFNVIHTNVSAVKNVGVTYTMIILVEKDSSIMYLSLFSGYSSTAHSERIALEQWLQ